MPTTETITDPWQALDDLGALITRELERKDLAPDVVDRLLAIKDAINRQKREMRGC